MIKTVMTPENENISIHLPAEYVGKKIEIFLYAVDELTIQEPERKIVDNTRLRGKLKLTDSQYKDFHKHANDIRNEWE